MHAPQSGNRRSDGDATGYLTADLARWGPTGTASPLTAQAASDYCRALCSSHYENFTVASWLLPRDLRRHFCHIYAYCRWADDLADEMPDAATGLMLLDWWEAELDLCLAGTPRHPVFVALRETITEFGIPREPLADLLVAFRRDQRQTRYARWDELFDYCRYSANPVGRLVLYLGRCHDAVSVALSDSICTGLQLANFCQDVARDYQMGRIYLPRDSWQAVGYGEEDFAAQRADERFRTMLREAVDRAEALLTQGWPLVARVPRPLRLDISLFIRGGLAILQSIRRQRYDVWARRPTVSRLRKLGLMLAAACGSWFSFRSPTQQTEAT